MWCVSSYEIQNVHMIGSTILLDSLRNYLCFFKHSFLTWMHRVSNLLSGLQLQLRELNLGSVSFNSICVESFWCVFKFFLQYKSAASWSKLCNFRILQQAVATMYLAWSAPGDLHRTILHNGMQRCALLEVRIYIRDMWNCRILTGSWHLQSSVHAWRISLLSDANLIYRVSTLSTDIGKHLVWEHFLKFCSDCMPHLNQGVRMHFISVWFVSWSDLEASDLIKWPFKSNRV